MRKLSNRNQRLRWWICLLCCFGLESPFLHQAWLQAAEEAEETGPDNEDNEVEDVAEAEDADAEEPVTFSNWLGGNTEYYSWMDFGVGGTIVDGSGAEFQRRNGLNDGVFGGLYNSHWEKFVGDNGLFSIDVRAVGGTEDYDIRLNYTDSEKGFIRGGYEQNRHWYNGSGGYYPPNGAWLPLDDQDLHLDRQRFWVAGQLTLENWPVISLNYEHQIREGEKDSTIWGTTSAAGGRGIAASFRGIDEHRDIIDALVEKNFGKTDAQIGVRYENTRIDNSLNWRAEAGTANESYLTQKDGNDTDLFNVHAATDTEFNEKWRMNTGYAFTTLDTTLSGSRIYGVTYDPIYDPAFARDSGFLDLTGGSRLNQHVAAVNVPWRPSEHFVVVPSVRFEAVGLDSSSSFSPTSRTGIGLAQTADSDKDVTELSQRLEGRYTGISKWVFYVRGDWAQGNGDLREQLFTQGSAVANVARDTDFSEYLQKYTAGANWYPIRRVGLSGQYYYKRRDNNYDHVLDSTTNDAYPVYPAYLNRQDFATHDANVRLKVIPFTSLVSVTRYDYQYSQIESGTLADSQLGFANVVTHIFSQSLTWNPWSRFYMQGTFSAVADSTHTPLSNYTATPGLLLDSNNDYWQAGGSIGFIIDNRTDIHGEYNYYRADNYEDNSAVSMPYGAGFREHRVMATLVRRVHENLQVLFRYGYFTYDDETSGGFNNYDAHLVYGGVQYRF